MPAISKEPVVSSKNCEKAAVAVPGMCVSSRCGRLACRQQASRRHSPVLRVSAPGS